MDRKLILLCAAAIPLGLAGGYAWSALNGPAPRAFAPPKATIADAPASPDELPEAGDSEWSSRAAGDPPPAAAAGGTVAGPSVYYPGCNAVRAAGKAPLHSDEPGYRVEMDGDGDGIACEPVRAR